MASEARHAQVDMTTKKLLYVYIHVVISLFFNTSPICSRYFKVPN